jgi:hypothetical protein
LQLLFLYQLKNLTLLVVSRGKPKLFCLLVKKMHGNIRTLCKSCKSCNCFYVFICCLRISSVVKVFQDFWSTNHTLYFSCTSSCQRVDTSNSQKIFNMKKKITKGANKVCCNKSTIEQSHWHADCL